ncbi:protein PFC0760c isoform X2 [Hydra vulgaris]|uniref:protein PFC0760c isoform X2 n=1 Tax=Hydra vulgaris TaxID=6087 RepID=UPI001F5ED8E3|nr:protein PFC0760c isoform X2 [Hydra vulgaris]
MNSVSCLSFCIAVLLLCSLYIEGKPSSIKAKKMKPFELRKFKTFKKISMKPFPVLQTRSSSGSHQNHSSLNKLDNHKPSNDSLVTINHSILNKTTLKHANKEKAKQNIEVKNDESNVESGSGDESGDNDVENENENIKTTAKNLIENYSDDHKNVFLDNFYKAVENSKIKGKNEITSHIIETNLGVLQPRALPTTYNTNLTIENSVHSYATFKSNIHLKPSSSIQQRGLLSDALKNANFSIQNSVHTYMVKKSNSKPNKKEKFVPLDPVDVVGVKRDNDPIEKRENYPIEKERNFMLKGKNPSDVAAEIEMNDKALIPLLSSASPKELRLDSETPNEETQDHRSRGKYGLPFEGGHESNYGKRDDSRHHDGNHEDHEIVEDNANEGSHYIREDSQQQRKEGHYYPDSDEEYRKKDSKESFYDNPHTRDKGDAHDYQESVSNNRDKYNSNQEEERIQNDMSYHRENNDHEDDDRDHQKKFDDDSYNERKRDHDYRDNDYKEKDYHDISDKSFHNKKAKNNYYEDKCDDKEKRNNICRNSGNDAIGVPMTAQDSAMTSLDEQVLQFQRDSLYSINSDISERPATIGSHHDIVQIGPDPNLSEAKLVNNDARDLKDDRLIGKQSHKYDDIVAPTLSLLANQNNNFNEVDDVVHSPAGSINSLNDISGMKTPTFNRKDLSIEEEKQKVSSNNDFYQDGVSAFSEIKSKASNSDDLLNVGNNDKSFFNKRVSSDFHQPSFDSKDNTLGSRRSTKTNKDDYYKEDFGQNFGQQNNVEEIYPFNQMNNRGEQSFHNHLDVNNFRENNEKKNWYDGEPHNHLNTKKLLKNFSPKNHLHPDVTSYDSAPYPPSKHYSQMVDKPPTAGDQYHPLSKSTHLTATLQNYGKGGQTLRQRMSNGQEIELSNRDYADYYHEHLGEYLKQANYDYKILGLQMSDFGLEQLLSRRKFQNINNQTLLTKVDVLQKLHDNSSSTLINDVDNTTVLSDVDNDTVLAPEIKNDLTKFNNDLVNVFNQTEHLFNEGSRNKTVNNVLNIKLENVNLKQKNETSNINSTMTDFHKKEKHGVRKATIPKKRKYLF